MAMMPKTILTEMEKLERRRLTGFCILALATGLQHMCELGSKEKNHRRIVDPNNDHDQRSGSAIGRTDSNLAQVKPNEEFPDREQQGRNGRSDPNIFPSDLRFRHVPEDKGE